MQGIVKVEYTPTNENHNLRVIFYAEVRLLFFGGNLKQALTTSQAQERGGGVCEKYSELLQYSQCLGGA